MGRRSDHTRPELTELALNSARSIVVSEGISGLSARKITGLMGYTVGTLYQVFEDMDDLVEQMNARTLAMLFDASLEGMERGEVAEQLKSFGIGFNAFIKRHPHEWDAVMSYRYKDGHTTSEVYQHELDRLFGLMEEATGQFYDESEKAQHAMDLSMLWACLNGILAVSNSERVVGGMTLEQMLEQLIAMYLKGRT